MKMSPVIKTDVKYSGRPQHLNVEVRFQSKAEINELIEALKELRESQGDDFDHFHLQDYSLAPGTVGLAEVNFFRPGLACTDLDWDGASEAREWLSKFGPPRPIEIPGDAEDA